MTPEEIKFFDNQSKTWDENEVLSTDEKVGDILSRLEIKGGSKVLDLGTGTGVLVPFLACMAGPLGHVDAVDISEGMLGEAVRKHGGIPNVRFHKLDFEKEPVEGKYDLIILYCVYPHLHTPETTLKRLAADNLRRDGRIVIAFPTDERYINNIHKEKKAESDMLPPADVLASRIRNWGLPAEVTAYDPGQYIVTVKAQEA